jgi:membrane-associated phospholipid phosphatase
MTSNRSTVPYILFAGALALLWLAMFLLGTGDEDLAILGLFYAGDRPFLADAARLLTLGGGWYVVTPVAAIVGVVVGLRGRPRLGLVLFVGTFIGRMLVEFQKYELGRLRPDQHPHLVNVYNLSFPSGHSANAMMVYVTMALTVVDPRRRTPWLAAAFLLAFVIGLSRLVLGVHWPSDVVGGWSFGLLWAMLLVWLSRHPPG